VADHSHLFRITCAGCEATWAGEDRAHCGACHHTFDDVGLWDEHRPRGQCVPPPSLGLATTKNGIWQRPVPDRRAS
jgi:hypothetical protein